MSPSTLFINHETGSLDTDELVSETIPLAKLVGLVTGIALIPLMILYVVGPQPLIAPVLTFVAQFILAVGSGLVLMYVISRAIQLS